MSEQAPTPQFDPLAEAEKNASMDRVRFYDAVGTSADFASPAEFAQANADFASYLKQRKFEDGKGDLHNPDGTYTSRGAHTAAEHYDTLAAEDVANTGFGEKNERLENLSLSQLAHRVAEARKSGDKTLAGDAEGVFMDKFADRYEPTKGKKSGHKGKSGKKAGRLSREEVDSLMDRYTTIMYGDEAGDANEEAPTAAQRETVEPVAFDAEPGKTTEDADDDDVRPTEPETFDETSDLPGMTDEEAREALGALSLGYPIGDVPSSKPQTLSDRLAAARRERGTTYDVPDPVYDDFDRFFRGDPSDVPIPATLAPVQPGGKHEKATASQRAGANIMASITVASQRVSEWLRADGDEKRSRLRKTIAVVGGVAVGALLVKGGQELFTHVFEQAAVAPSGNGAGTHAAAAHEVVTTHTGHSGSGHAKINTHEFPWQVAHQATPGHEVSSMQHTMDALNKQGGHYHFKEVHGVTQIYNGNHSMSPAEMQHFNEMMLKQQELETLTSS